MGITKKAANDIANKAVAELGGDWQNKTFVHGKWIPKIESESLGIYLIYDNPWSGPIWLAYSELDNGLLCHDITPSKLMDKIVETYESKIDSYHSMIKTFHSRIENIKLNKINMETKVSPELTKEQAIEIAKKTIVELGGNWQNKVNMTQDFYVKIYSKDLGIKLVFNPLWNGGLWSVYSDLNHGFICAAETPKDALINTASFYESKVDELQKNLSTPQTEETISEKVNEHVDNFISNLIKIYQNRIGIIRGIVNK